MPKGGTRIGAGRPATDKSRLVIHVTENERKAILELLESMRQTNILPKET